MRIKSYNHRKDRCYRKPPALRPNAADENRPGFFGRLYAAIMESRQSEANRQIAHLLSQSGGRLTDEMERRLAERVMGKGNFRLD